MMYKKLENNWLIVPSEMTPTKEFWRVMGKHSRQIVCVDKIDPDVTLHPAGIEWDVNGVHKWLPFVKGAGIHSLDEVTKVERQNLEIAQIANEKRPDKERKRAEREEEQNKVDEFYATPVGEKKVIFDTKMEAFIPEEAETMEISEPVNIIEEPEQDIAPIATPKKKGRPSKK